MHRKLLLLLSLAISIGSLAQQPFADADHREHAAQVLAAKKPKRSVRIITAQGSSKENLFVIDPAFKDVSQRLDFLASQEVKALADEGFVAVVMKDSENNYWGSKVCPDHFSPMEQLLKNGVEIKPSGPSLGFSLSLSCNGLQLDKIVLESAAAKANLRSGDYLISINAQKVNTRTEVVDFLNREKGTETIELGIQRDGQILSFKIRSADAMNFKPSSPWPDAYSRRNYQLGITISQFRTLPYPDQDQWPNSYPICSDDPRGHTVPFLLDLIISDDWKNAGIIQCTFFYNSSAINQPLRAALMLGDISSLTSFYFISQEGQQEPRLFLIKSAGPSDSYGDLLKTFVAAFGKPSNITKEQFQTKTGSVFPNEIAVWENNNSSIQLSHFGQTTEVLQVTHSLKPLVAVFEKRLAEGQAMKAKKL
jgi:hypothetical protein